MTIRLLLREAVVRGWHSGSVWRLANLARGLARLGESELKVVAAFHFLDLLTAA
jgi:hypothetical protein